MCIKKRIYIAVQLRCGEMHEPHKNINKASANGLQPLSSLFNSSV